MSIGVLIDELHILRGEKAELNKLLKRIADQEKDLQTRIITSLEEQGIDGAKGNSAQVSIVDKVIPIIEDGEAFNNWVVQDVERVSCLQRRLASRTIQEMWGEDIAIPGVNKLHQKQLSVRKK